MNLLIGFIVILLSVPAIIIVSMLIHFVIAIKEYGLPEKKNVKEEKESVVKRLFWDFPKQFMYDVMHKNPNEFDMFGFHLFAGEQGCGKTIALTQKLMQLKKKYPMCKISTNYCYANQDSEITHWRDLVFQNNGIYGQIQCIDEIQNWFSSLQSKDFPVEMLMEITQQRKQRKIMFGTSQEFQRLAKPLREKVNYLYEPFTIAGCVTFVRVTKPLINEDGSVIKKRPHKLYFFVQTPEIREMFDTYKKVASMAEEGFYNNNLGSDIHITTEQPKRGLFGRKR